MKLVEQFDSKARCRLLSSTGRRWSCVRSDRATKLTCERVARTYGYALPNAPAKFAWVSKFVAPPGHLQGSMAPTGPGSGSPKAGPGADVTPATRMDGVSRKIAYGVGAQEPAE